MSTHVVWMLVFALAPAFLYAQGSRGMVSGEVQDSTGALVPGAAVTVTNENTGLVTQVQSQPNGVYLAPQLLPGTYRVAVEMQGFKRLEIGGLTVNVGSTLNQNLVLEVGVVTESVKVAGQSSLIETTSGQVGSTVQIDQVLEMPLVDRNVFSLVNLVPGAFFTENGAVSIGGGRTQSALAMLDGVNNSRGGLAVQNIEMAPPIDSMQEFKVEVNNMGAEYGRSSAGLVNAITKGGTNRFHGSVYEFIRNNAFDAAGWNNDEKPPLRRNNYGFTIGGPIRKNKTFFFYNLDGLRQKDGVVRTRSVGLPEWRTGNFSTATRDAAGRAVPVVIYDPDTGNGTFAEPRSNTPFPGNIIPSNRLDPVAVKALSYLPNPNRTPNNPFNFTGNWQENSVNINTRDYHTARVDHELSPKTRLFVRYILTQPEDSETAYTNGYGVADPDGLTIHNRRQNLALNATHLFSPTFFLNFTTGFNRVLIRRTSGDCCETNYGQQFGLPNVPGTVFPRFNVGGGVVPVDPLGAVGNADRTAPLTNTDFTAKFTNIRGNHTLKFGGEHRRFNGNELQRPFPSGQWVFNGRFTRGINANGGAIANTGTNLADMLLGRLNAVNAEVGLGYGKRIQYYSGYFQDDWRVSSKLTLNLGIRYETETPVYEVAGRMNNFDPYSPNPLAGTGDIPAGAIGVVTYPNRNGKGKYLWRWDKNNVAPRFGFAYRLFGNDTVLRGGFGIYFGNPYDREVIQGSRAGFDSIYQGRHPLSYRLRDGAPKGALEPIPESELLPSFGNRGTRFENSTIQFLDPDRVTQYSENVNLTLQHQWKSTLFEIGYIGNLGRQVPFPNINLNHIPTELLPRTEIPVRFRRPWTVFTSDQPQIQILSPNWGFSNYHGMTLKLERRVQNGFGFTVAYTFAQWIDNLVFVGGDGATFGDDDQIQNIYDLKNERSRSTNGVPHRVVLSPIVDLPFGKGRNFLNRGGVLNAIVGGWQVATIATLRSGAPFGMGVLNGALNVLGDGADGKNLRPDLVSSQLYVADDVKGTPAQGVRGIQWLNPEAFATPRQFTHGNSSRTLPGVLGPGSVQFDSMLAKNFRVGERYRAQFRWEMFNTFNTPAFGLPAQIVGQGNLGVVTDASSRRIMQFGLKLYF